MPERVVETRQQPCRELTLWLLSDMALMRDAQPVLKPEPTDLGLPQGRLVVEKSFIRSRRYAPFNGKRHAPDLERQVISAGSVLHFEFDELVAADELPASFGLFRECGLGAVMVNPVLLSAEHPQCSPAIPVRAAEAVSKPAHALVSWLEHQADLAGATREIHANAAELMDELTGLYEAARNMAGGLDVGPGKTQWGRVREAAMQADNVKKLRHVLFDPSSGICKSSNNEDWMQDSQDAKGSYTTFRDWLENVCKPETDDILQMVALLAQKAADYHARQGEKV